MLQAVGLLDACSGRLAMPIACDGTPKVKEALVRMLRVAARLDRWPSGDLVVHAASAAWTLNVGPARGVAGMFDCALVRSGTPGRSASVRYAEPVAAAWIDRAVDAMLADRA